MCLTNYTEPKSNKDNIYYQWAILSDQGNIISLNCGNSEPQPFDTWLRAEDYSDGKKYIPFSNVGGLYYRAGWHVLFNWEGLAAYDSKNFYILLKVECVDIILTGTQNFSPCNIAGTKKIIGAFPKIALSKDNVNLDTVNWCTTIESLTELIAEEKANRTNLCPHCSAELDYVKYWQGGSSYGTVTKYKGWNYDEDYHEGDRDMDYYCPECDSDLSHEDVEKILGMEK